MPVVKNKKAKVVKKTAKVAKPVKAVAKLNTLTAQQKKDFKMQLAVATQEAYFKGRYEEARDQEKSAAALEKVISAAVAQFDKKQQKLAKIASKKLDKQLSKLGIKPAAAKAEKAVVKTAKKIAKTVKPVAKKAVKAVKSAEKKVAKAVKPVAKKVVNKATKAAKTIKNTVQSSIADLS